jgi:hypothetical protein
MNDIALYGLIAFIMLVTTLTTVHGITGFHP